MVTNLTGSWTVFQQTQDNYTASCQEADPEDVLLPGWYVLGGEYLNEGAEVVLHIDEAFDDGGYHAHEQVARLVAAALRIITAD